MALKNNPDRDWQSWGNTNPYFGVLSDPKYLDVNLNDEARRSFFDSGEQHIEHIYSVIRAKIRPDFRPDRVLDYGCGVGRLIVPLSKRSQTVIGVDVSPGMLEQAGENCQRNGVCSARLMLVDEMESLAPASLDLVHSFIVFQHIPIKRGELILRKLIVLLATGGVGAIHITYANTRSALRRVIFAVRQRVGIVHRLLNLLQRRQLSSPHMQMNCYSVNRIFDILFEEGCSNLHVEFLKDAGYRGAVLYFEKLPPTTRMYVEKTE